MSMRVVVLRVLLIQICILIALYLAFLPPSRADDAIKLHEVSVNYKHFDDTNFAPYFTQPQTERVTLTLNTTVFEYFFFNNNVHGTTQGNQFHQIGWQYQLGVHVSYNLDILYEHHSQHLLDTAFPGHFPLENSIGFTLYFVRPEKSKSIF